MLNETSSILQLYKKRVTGEVHQISTSEETNMPQLKSTDHVSYLKNLLAWTLNERHFTLWLSGCCYVIFNSVFLSLDFTLHKMNRELVKEFHGMKLTAFYSWESLQLYLNILDLFYNAIKIKWAIKQKQEYYMRVGLIFSEIWQQFIYSLFFYFLFNSCNYVFCFLTTIWKPLP